MSKALYTDYSALMDAEIPHAYYPRPNLERDSFICLNGSWDFATTKSRECDEYTEKILVPFPPESALSGVFRSVGKDEYMHYRRQFTLPKDFIKDRVILHFGAVDQICSVYVNGHLAGENEGGYIPFSFDITDLICQGENLLSVRVKDELSKIYPYGKQTDSRGGMWYTPVSGIWQSVWLESAPKNYIRSLKISPTLDFVKIEIDGGETKKRITLEGEVYEFEGDSITITPKTVEHWTPENPKLYYFTLESGEDRVKSYFALREVGCDVFNGIPRLTLNGKPYLFNGLLDQGYFPDGLFLPATLQGYEEDIALAKRLGFNMLRKHIKIEPLVFYYLCDKMGIAVFQDMVNNSEYSFVRDTALATIGIQKLPDSFLNKNPESRRIFEDTMYKTCELLYNFPSVVYYTIFNEGWGQFCADKMYVKLKEKDSTRIIDSTSGWFRRKESDVDSRHIYFRKLKVKGRNNKPLVISEFGGYSYRVPGHLFGEGNYGYKNFESREQFEDAFINLYETEVLPLVSLGASALVYTQISDVEDETNGLVTYDRRVVKVDEERSRDIMEKIRKIVE